MTRTPDRIFALIVLSALVLVIAVIADEILAFYQDPETYANVYRLGANEGEWEWLYLRRFIYPVVLAVGGFVIFVLKAVYAHNTRISTAYRWFVMIFMISAIYWFYNLLSTYYDV
ncbi:MAG TPA: hypothetical protein VEB86_19830 [Chryseosolibacter sp.]|nr:hypothetical protein [Chryseosolibacter sp.]